MHHSRPLPLAFEGAEQGFGGKNCQKCQGKPCIGRVTFKTEKL